MRPLTRGLQALVDKWLLHPGLARAAALSLQAEAEATSEILQQLRIEERKLSHYLVQSLPNDTHPVPIGAPALANLASCRVLCLTPAERKLDQLPRAVADSDGAAACLAFLCNAADTAALTTRGLDGRQRGPSDLLLLGTLQRLMDRDGAGIAALFRELGPAYEAAVAERPWLCEPGQLFHIRLLATLVVASERGLVDLAELPAIPYVPIAIFVPRDHLRVAPLAVR